jgi:hypothetical protein
VEKEGIVSIWLGISDSIKELQEYLQVYYSNEVDFINSKFEKDFNIQCFDEDLREINYLEQCSASFSIILSQHSYSQSIISNYIDKFGDELDKKYNSIILLYDFDYMGSVKEASHEGLVIKFIGTVEYNRSN